MHQTSIRHAGDLRSRDRVRDRQPFTIVGTATLVTVLVCGASVLVRGAELTELERQRLVAHLEMTGNWLLDEVSNLSERQLEFRRAPDSWNIKEVLEHLIVVGPIYWNDLQKAVKGPATDRQPSPSGGDAGILWYGIDRTHRETAIPPERPKGELRDVARSPVERVRRDEQPERRRMRKRLWMRDLRVTGRRRFVGTHVLRGVDVHAHEVERTGNDLQILRCELWRSGAGRLVISA